MQAVRASAKLTVERSCTAVPRGAAFLLPAPAAPLAQPVRRILPPTLGIATNLRSGESPFCSVARASRSTRWGAERADLDSTVQRYRQMVITGLELRVEQVPPRAQLPSFLIRARSFGVDLSAARRPSSESSLSIIIGLRWDCASRARASR